MFTRSPLAAATSSASSSSVRAASASPTMSRQRAAFRIAKHHARSEPTRRAIVAASRARRSARG